MSKQSESTIERDLQQEKPGAENLVLPDESDRIIDDLKSQLSALQGQLETYRQSEAAPGDTEKPARSGKAQGADPGGRDDWDAAFAPRIVSRLQGPAEDLTGRLARLIQQVQDPALRRELEHCQKTAFYLFDTFRQISENHRALMASIDDKMAPLGVEVFRRALAEELASGADKVPVEIVEGQRPATGWVPHSLLTVANTLKRVASQLIGEVEQVRVEYSDPGGPGETLNVTIACGESRDDLAGLTGAAEVVFMPGVSAMIVVDWLYMEKIVELRGGRLVLHHVEGKAAGFRIILPLAAAAEAQQAEPG